jgi:hypothetical protein
MLHRSLLACGAPLAALVGLAASACVSSSKASSGSNVDAAIPLPGEDGAVPFDTGAPPVDGSVGPADATTHSDGSSDAGAPSDSSSSSDGAMVADAAPATCPADGGLAKCATPIWTVPDNGGTSCVTSAGLVMIANAVADPSQNYYAVSQANLDGNFTLTITFDQVYVPTAENVEVSVNSTGNNGAVSASAFSNEIVAEYNEPDGGYIPYSEPVGITSGTITVTRTASGTTINIAQGASYASAEGTVTGPVSVSMGVRGYTNGPATVAITSVTVTGNTGTFMNDSFTCNSLP